MDFHEIAPAEIDVPARTCFIDIECEDERGFPDPQRDKIICITCHDSFDEDYTTFLLVGGMPDEITRKEEDGGLANGCFRKGTHTICIYADEVAMLKGFATYLVSRDPDVLSGWNFVDFDMPYITDRMERLGLRPDSLARIPGMTERNALRGRVLFDLLAAYKKMHLSLKESYRLDAVAHGGTRRAEGPVHGDDLGPLEERAGASSSSTTSRTSSSASGSTRRTTSSSSTARSPGTSAARSTRPSTPRV